MKNKRILAAARAPRILLPFLAALVLGLYQADTGRVSAASNLALANDPLFLKQAVEPNVMFLIDDSGSMDAEVMTPYTDSGYVEASRNIYKVYRKGTYLYNGNLGGYIFNNGSNNAGPLNNGLGYVPSSDPRPRSYQWNSIYYNPNMTYTPWPGTDTKTFGNANPKAAPNDPMDAAAGTTDLTQSGIAVYYTLPNGVSPATASHTGGAAGTGDYVLNTIDPSNTAQMQNFANWYVYYRKRIYAAKNGIASAIANLSGMRVGLTDIYNTGTILVPLATITNSTAQKNKLLNTLYGLVASGGTPLRTSLQAVGEYFKTKGSAAPITAPCQQNFTILMTDGYWNGASPGVGNVDGGKGKPYEDDHSDTLADVAMKYYEENLRPDLAEGQVELAPGTHETNSNPHMDTFTIGFGVSGTLDSSVDPYQNPPAWPAVSANDKTTVDDLWHAAVNGRGQFLSAKDPQALLNTLNSYLANIAGRTASAAAVSLNSTSISSTTHLYQARFDSAFWVGDLRAYGIDQNTGAVKSTPVWSAQSELDSLTGNGGWDSKRIMATWNPSSNAGVAFRWDSLSSSQQNLLNNNGADTLGAARLDYLRGDKSKEGNPFRTRQHILGDIINSQPVYVGKPPFLYNYQNYDAFKTTGTAANRPGMVYVGGNDGALHAFDAATGTERFAFVPNGVFPKLAGLTNTNFTHQYRVDGSPAVGDVTFSDNSWHTILVGGLNNGGKSVYALDVTDPASITTEAALAGKVLWEFTDTDLGQTFSRPVVVPLRGNSQGTTWQWVVIFGSGYNNSNGKPYLYVLNAQTGVLLKKIDLCGSSSPACDTNLPNGLASPAAVASNGGDLVDAVYAGDLQGNMWKIDLSDSNPNKWQVAYQSAGKNVPLFKATDSLGNPQPITTAPDVTFHPKHPAKTGVMVYFGTGKYLESTDITDTSHQQTFYGIWDSGAALGTFNRNTTPTSPNLQEQQLDTVSIGGQLVRVSERNPINWNTQKGWYTDLPTAGERSITNPQVVAGRVLFTTFIPDSSACGRGGKSWLMVLDYARGTSFSKPEMDINKDNVLDDKDLVSNPPSGFDGVPTGMSLGQGLAASPAVIGAGTAGGGGISEIKYMSKSDTSIEAVKERGGGAGGSQPISWRELF
ncbi:MAG: pilus assembly protein [Pseudomonadota bacterium]